MSKIKILSEHLANQIAAGEVVERPASIVKELLENAIDAGAGQISIQVEGDGTRLIRIIDDGEGMDQDDVLLCLERHATSKLELKSADDHELPVIKTLGFRGEAIPSIAAVARLTISSRPESARLGTRAEILYGKVARVHEAGCNRGTVMEVRDLFANLPVRKKFLKSDRTELFHIEEVVKDYCLVNPQIGISFMVDGKTVMNLPAISDTLADRVRRICGSRDLSLIPVAAAARENRPALSGYLLPPDETYGLSARLRFFVNGRAVKDRTMAHAVNEGLAGYLMKGRKPAGALFLLISPAEVDVNVHPTKQEVRFLRPDMIHRLIAQAVRQAMAEYQQSLRDFLFEMPAANTPVTAAASAGQGPYSGLDSSPGLPGLKKSSRFPGVENRPFAVFTAEPESSFLRDNMARQSSMSESPGPESPFRDSFSLTPIGQLLNLYLVCQSSDGLVLIDQHAAHERLIFEELKKQHGAARLNSQLLIFPVMLELDDAQITVLEAYKNEINQLGIEIEEFGDGSYLVKSVPSLLGHLPPEEIIIGVLEQYVAPEYEKKNIATRIEAVLAGLACKAAVKAGKELSPAEMNELLQKMRKSNAFSHCPHGRPVFKSFSVAEIKKWFHRT